MKVVPNKYKIMVLSNLKDDLDTILTSTVRLAQTFNGEIVVFNVQKPSEVVQKESQLSAVKAIYSKRISTDKKMQGIVGPVSELYDMGIKHSCAIGNVKNEIFNYIKKYQPDMVVLGKRKPTPLKFIGDSITEYILNSHKGDTVIIPGENNLKPKKEISLGMLNITDNISNFKLSKQLLEQTKGPIKSFRFVNNEQNTKVQNTNTDTKTIEYLFEHNENALEKLPSYVSKNNINLLLINNNIKDTNMKQLNFGNLINRLNVPLMVMGKKT